MEFIALMAVVVVTAIYFATVSATRHKQHIELLKDIKTDVSHIYLQTNLRRADGIANTLACLRREFSGVASDIDEETAASFYNNSRHLQLLWSRDVVPTEICKDNAPSVKRYQRLREVSYQTIIDNAPAKVKEYLKSLSDAELKGKLGMVELAALKDQG